MIRLYLPFRGTALPKPKRTFGIFLWSAEIRFKISTSKEIKMKSEDVVEIYPPLLIRSINRDFKYSKFAVSRKRKSEGL